ADARSGRTTVELLMDPASGERRASVLAAKAVDLLKAVLAEVPASERRALPPPAPVAPVIEATAVPSPAAEPVVDRPDRVLLAGVDWLRAGGVQTFAPTLSFAWLAGHLGGRAVLAGLGTSTDVPREQGSARLAQNFALL